MSIIIRMPMEVFTMKYSCLIEKSFPLVIFCLLLGFVGLVFVLGVSCCVCLFVFNYAASTNCFQKFLKSFIFVFYSQQTFWKVRHILVIFSGFKHCHSLARFLFSFSSHQNFVNIFKNSVQSIPPQTPLWYEMGTGSQMYTYWSLWKNHPTHQFLHRHTEG